VIIVFIPAPPDNSANTLGISTHNGQLNIPASRLDRVQNHATMALCNEGKYSMMVYIQNPVMLAVLSLSALAV
jgi:hypothetical protein